MTFLPPFQINLLSKSRNILAVLPAHSVVLVPSPVTKSHHPTALFHTSSTVTQSQNLQLPLKGSTTFTKEAPCVPNITVFCAQCVVCLDPTLKCSIKLQV